MIIHSSKAIFVPLVWIKKNHIQRVYKQCLCASEELHQCIWVFSFFHHLNFNCFSVFFSVFVFQILWLLWFNVVFAFTVDGIKKTNKCGYCKKKLYHREVTFLVNNNYPYSGLQVLGHILPDQFHKSFLLLWNLNFEQTHNQNSIR